MFMKKSVYVIMALCMMMAVSCKNSNKTPKPVDGEVIDEAVEAVENAAQDAAEAGNVVRDLALEALDDIKGTAEEAAAKALRSKEKDIEAQKKFMTDKIDSTVKSRRNALEKTHDEQINAAKKELRSARKEKTDAKNEAVSERITDETSALVTENSKIRSRIKTLFRQAKIPGFCNSDYYYAMFATRTAKDFVIFAITVVIAVAVIPNIVCALIKTTTTIKILIYIGIVVLFLLIYFLVFFWTRAGSKAKVIERVRPDRKRYAENRKQIKNISKNIRVDQDESTYGLHEFDAEIARCEQIAQQCEEAREAALQEFDEHTATAIKAEIESENLPIIEQMEQEAAQLKNDLSQKQSESQAATTLLANNYTSFLGAKNCTPEKIDELIALIRDGKAQTIMQAIDLQNGEISNQ